MKNYYFDNDLNLLVEDEVDDCEKVSYIVVNDVEKFKAFCDRICMIDYGVTSTKIYYFNFDEEEWQELDGFVSLPIYEVLDKYINKTEDEPKENDTMDNKEKTFNFSIEFKNGGFISEENCNKSFNEIINSVKDLYNSAVFDGNVKKIVIEMN